MSTTLRGLLVAGLGLMILAAACETADSSPAGTRVRGRVVAGPTCPVVTDPPEPGCEDRAVAGAVLIVRTAAGIEVARVTSGADGGFEVELTPGRYRLEPQEVDRLMGTPAPLDLQVTPEGAPELEVAYDTGIR